MQYFNLFSLCTKLQINQTVDYKNDVLLKRVKNVAFARHGNNCVHIRRGQLLIQRRIEFQGTVDRPQINCAKMGQHS